MNPVIILDSSPLGLLFQKTGIKESDDCRAWLKRHVGLGEEVVVPEIIHYELRRELLRLRKTAAVKALDEFVQIVPDRLIPITSGALNLASELWAIARQRGEPTAPPEAIDIDVILAAQVILRYPIPQTYVVATSNLAHLSRFVPAEIWSKI